MTSQDVETINRLLTKRLKCNEAIKPRSGGYNCWGFTAYSHGLTDKPYWLRDYEKEEILKEHCVEVDTPKRGDIIAFYGLEYGVFGLLHTALYLHNGYILHKEGTRPVEIAKLEKVYETYEDECGFEITQIKYWRKKR